MGPIRASRPLFHARPLPHPPHGLEYVIYTDFQGPVAVSRLTISAIIEFPKKKQFKKKKKKKKKNRLVALLFMKNIYFTYAYNLFCQQKNKKKN
jgi:hypothetical protein